MSRTALEQEFYEQFREQGTDEYTANEMAHDWAVDVGEYDNDPLADQEPTP
jgi:hypothetical protein